jgi:hypothetical protein
VTYIKKIAIYGWILFIVFIAFSLASISAHRVYFYLYPGPQIFEELGISKRVNKVKDKEKDEAILTASQRIMKIKSKIDSGGLSKNKSIELFDDFNYVTKKLIAKYPNHERAIYWRLAYFLEKSKFWYKRENIDKAKDTLDEGFKFMNSKKGRLKNKEHLSTMISSYRNFKKYELGELND